MKIRQGFVSNSSSSSFTCDFCDKTYSGYDGAYEGSVAKTTCQNGHVLCGHILEREETEQSIEEKRRTLIEKTDSKNQCNRLEEATAEEILQTWEEDIHDEEYEELFPSRCPICRFHKILDQDFIHFLLAYELSWSREKVEDTIRRKFETYVEFVDFLEDNPIPKE